MIDEGKDCLDAVYLSNVNLAVSNCKRDCSQLLDKTVISIFQVLKFAELYVIQDGCPTCVSSLEMIY